MIIYTIGFTKKTASQFFEPLKKNGIQLLIDVRLNNHSQLAGFTKFGDVQYFLKEICNIDYIHAEEYAPTKELLKNYQDGIASWNEYEVEFNDIMEKRKTAENFIKRFSSYDKVCLLCSESTPEHCHRRLVAEKIKSFAENSIQVIHL